MRQGAGFPDKNGTWHCRTVTPGSPVHCAQQWAKRYADCSTHAITWEKGGRRGFLKGRLLYCFNYAQIVICFPCARRRHVGTLQNTATLCSGTRHQQNPRHFIPPSHWLHLPAFKENPCLFQATSKILKTLPNISSLCCDHLYFIWCGLLHQDMPALGRIRKPQLFCPGSI